jgi:hypothetical protein
LANTFSRFVQKSDEKSTNKEGELRSLSESFYSIGVTKNLLIQYKIKAKFKKKLIAGRPSPNLDLSNYSTSILF